jgi:hypothetical protein
MKPNQKKRHCHRIPGSPKIDATEKKKERKGKETSWDDCMQFLVLIAVMAGSHEPK